MDHRLDAVALAYEASISPLKWPEALTAIARVGGSGGCCLVMSDTYGEHAYNFTMLSDNYDMAAAHRYFDEFLGFEDELWKQAVSFLSDKPEFTTVADISLLPDATDVSTIPAFREFSTRFGMLRKVAVLLNARAPWNDGLGFQYHNSHVEIPATAQADITLISPYLARAAALIRPARAVAAEYGMLLNALEKLAIGVAVVSRKGTIILSNTSFSRVLDLGALYSDPARRLRASDTDLDGRILRLIDGTAQTSVATDLHGGGYLTVPVPGRTHPLSIEISPLGRSGRDSPTDGWSIIFAVDPEWRLVTRSRHVAEAYRLTPVEIVVCELILQGRTNREIAEIRVTGIETIKTHVANLLAKTWTRNRTELARLAAAAELPLVDPTNDQGKTHEQ